MFTITSHVATLPPKERLKIINLLLQELEPKHLDKAYNSRLSDLEETIPRKELNKILKSANQN